MKQLGENDPVLIKALEDIVQASLSEALSQKPVFTLREILPHKTAVDLKGLAKASQVTGYSKMKKAESVGCKMSTIEEVIDTVYLNHLHKNK